MENNSATIAATLRRILVFLALFGVHCIGANAATIFRISAVGQSLSKGLCVAGGSNPCDGSPPSTVQYGSNQASNPILTTSPPPGTAFVTLTAAHVLNNEYPGIEAINQITYES